MAQIKQSASYPKARNGMLEGQLHQFTIDGSRVVETAAAKAGTFVTRGSTAGKCKPPTSAAEVQVSGLGFLAADAAKGANGTANEYAVGDAASIVLQGPGVWCVAQEALAPGEPVFVVHAAAGRGMIRNDVDTANAAQLFGATVQEYIADTTWGGTGIARINMPRVADFS
jgi:hypothetical protein